MNEGGWENTQSNPKGTLNLRLPEEPSPGVSIATALHQNIKRKTILVDSAPKVMMPTFDLEDNFVQQPFVATFRLLPA